MCAWRSACSNEENLEAIRQTVEAAAPRRQGSAGRLRAFLRWLQGQSRLCARLRQKRPMTPARAGWCSATPMAAACRRRSRPSFAPSPRWCPGSISASTPMTTPSRPSPIRWRRCWPARARSRARSTASANAAAMPISSRSFRLWRSRSRFAAASRPASCRDRLKTLTHVSRAFDELLNRGPHRQAPYVGKSAFATKAGIHASAIVKEPETYEHVPPETVGNRRRMLVSDQAGKSNLIAELSRIGIDGREGRPATRPAAARGQGARGARLCL